MEGIDVLESSAQKRFDLGVFDDLQRAGHHHHMANNEMLPFYRQSGRS
jgi:hypothetical protein